MTMKITAFRDVTSCTLTVFYCLLSCGYTTGHYTNTIFAVLFVA
jgi:hypothetical protein